MPLLITCSKCERKLRVPETAQGRAVKCPGCGNVIRIPAAEDAVEEIVPQAKARRVDDDEVAPPKAKRPRVDDDDDDVDDAPRRKASRRLDNDDEQPRRMKRRAEDESDDEDRDDEDEEPAPRKRPRRSRSANLALRVIVIVLAVLAGLVSAVPGVVGTITRTETIATCQDKNTGGIVKYQDKIMPTEEAEDLARHERIAFILMVVNLGLAIVCAIAAGLSRGWMGGVLMLLAPVGPAIIEPITLVFTCLFVPAAIVSFFVWPRRAID